MPISNGKIAGKFAGGRVKKINSAIIFTIITCLIPALILLLAGKPKTARAAAAGDYITLITGGQIQDSVVAAKLDAAGIKNVLSESSQWFFVNDFSELRRVPLDQFNDFMLESDPRNDGYAEKLKKFFMRDGSRYFYIPRRSIHSSNPAVIERRIIDALDGIPYRDITFNAYTARNISGAFIFIAATLFSLVLSVYAAKPFASRRAAIKPLLKTAVLLPACALFAASGPAGFALAAILLTLFFMFRAPLKSLFIKLRLAHEAVFSGLCFRLVKQYIFKEKKLPFIILALFAAVCISGGVNIFYALLAALLFCLSAASFIYLETSPRGAAAHIRFVPIAIRTGTKLRLPLTALPFTLASIFSLAIPLFAQPRIQVLGTKAKNEAPLISVKDYQYHINFQKNFAFIKLDNGNSTAAASAGAVISGAVNGGAVPYLNFELGPDGLLHIIDGGPSANNMLDGSADDIPPFPLENLLNFLNSAESNAENAGKNFTPAVFDIRGLIAIVIALAVYIPYPVFAALGRTKEKNSLYLSERIVA
ncbi:MAG: hypothetical protein LBK66_01270 [Spirochaetaceae bacterium]|jgi:hypothetical protein|nr:hypothetical protein [Spirochaetaceae bacterium]